MNNKPFLLKPAAKDYLWGGNRLNTEFNKNIDIEPLAETWECSTHPDGLSIVASGEYSGMTLADVLKQHPDYIGIHPLENSIDGKAELPILIKFIDANKDLSVQVHPDDEYAYRYENGKRGKTEMWYVLDAKEDASLIYGLQFEMSKDDVYKKIEEGKLGTYLQKVAVEKDDVFFISPGTIHAIGAGTLIAEIQENSNLTYRIYDYDRIDKNGKKRELHLDKALDVSCLKANAKPRQSMRTLKYKKNSASELIGRCQYFEVYRWLLNTDENHEGVKFQADKESFHALLCVEGKGTITVKDSEMIEFDKGDCVFVPADSEVLIIKGQVQMLDVRG